LGVVVNEASPLEHGGIELTASSRLTQSLAIRGPNFIEAKNSNGVRTCFRLLSTTIGSRSEQRYVFSFCDSSWSRYCP
jgi:hypothetical protein